jgi:hypothetical protein
MADDTEVKNAVCITKGYLKQILNIFELNPQLTAGGLTTVLHEQLWWAREGIPNGENDHYWSRNTKALGTFCRKQDLIVADLGMKEECPVSQL